ncbi:MAG: hypothetical protein K6E10_05595 [Eubacterium sp.]|nr:hypothetical protein [Eubacterium sp.]
MSELADAIQIIRLTIDGVEIAMKLGSASLGTMQKAAKFLKGMLEYEQADLELLKNLIKQAKQKREKKT